MVEREGTEITYSEVRNDAEILTNKARSMDAIFTEFEGSMKKVGSRDVFVGDASESLDAKFTKLKAKFADYVQLVNDFSTMMKSAADATEKTESELSGDTGDLQS